jgi:hypothetical protein
MAGAERHADHDTSATGAGCAFEHGSHRADLRVAHGQPVALLFTRAALRLIPHELSIIPVPCMNSRCNALSDLSASQMAAWRTRRITRRLEARMRAGWPLRANADGESQAHCTQGNTRSLFSHPFQ